MKNKYIGIRENFVVDGREAAIESNQYPVECRKQLSTFDFYVMLRVEIDHGWGDGVSTDIEVHINRPYGGEAHQFYVDWDIDCEFWDIGMDDDGEAVNFAVIPKAMVNPVYYVVTHNALDRFFKLPEVKARITQIISEKMQAVRGNRK